ncbi:MAG TPA: sulfotransferase [Croceibacterium sp.]
MAAPTIGYNGGSLEAGLANGARLLDADPAAAALQARALLQAAPREPAAHRLFARAMAALGETEEARKARARAVQFSRHVRPVAEGHKAVLAGRLDEAQALLREHLAHHPDDPVALMVRGEALARLGNKAEAVRSFEAALAFMPEYVEARLGLVRAHQQAFDQVAALAALEPLLAERPDEPNLLRWKATLLSNLDEHEAAARVLEALAEARPGDAEIRVSLGDEMRTLGRAAEAHAAYRRAVQAAPLDGSGWWGLAALRHAPLDAADQEQIEAALAQGPAAARGRAQLHFALAVACEQADDRERAFAHFAAGNAVRHAAEPFDPATVETEVRRSRAVLTREFLAARRAAGCAAPDPIFIVGMPRSGSTLVEQVLAGHPQIEGTAELPIVPVLIRTMAAARGFNPGRSYRDLLPDLTPSELAALGEEYLRLARPHRKSDKPFFLDKLPHNWADVGFIKLILPQARIIDVRRAPMDCCWSNFRMLFARGHPSSNSLEGMAAYYRHYVAMMTHFDEALPGAVHRVIYERLVDNFEAEVRRLLDHLGLPFDPACLDFHANDRPVATASAEQVRRPLNRAGIGAWREYERWLGSLSDAVGDLEQTYAR